MKLLIDYTEKELSTISEAEKNTLYLLELANRGIALPDSVPAFIESPEKDERFTPDLMLHTFSVGYSSSDLFFENIEDMNKVIELVNTTATKADYDYKNSTKIYHVTRDVEVNTSSVPAYSVNKYNELKDEMTIYEKKINAINSNNSRRKELINKQSDVMDEIDTAISNANRNINRVAELKTLFNQYLTMASNDHDIAVRFMMNANMSELSGYDADKLDEIGITSKSYNDYMENKVKVEEDEQN